LEKKHFEIIIYYAPEEPTIQISGNPSDLLDLGHAFLKADRIVIIGSKTQSTFYPIVLRELRFEPLPETDALLRISIDQERLLLSGGTDVAKRLGQSLINVFSGPVSDGHHFHLDYYEDNGFLDPTNIGLIFQCQM
jgi:hypothetical protein